MAAGEIEDLRGQLDRVDSMIIKLLEERMELCKRIGVVKAKAGLPVRDPAREIQVLERSGRFREVFKAIIELCVEEQGG